MNREDFAFYKISGKPIIITDFNDLVEYDLIEVRRIVVYESKLIDNSKYKKEDFGYTFYIKALALYDLSFVQFDILYDHLKGTMQTYLMSMFNEHNVLRLIANSHPDIAIIN